MILRKAEMTDLPALVKIEDRSFSAPWSEKGMRDALDTEAIYTLVAEEDGTLLGYIMIALLGIEAEIYNVAVDPDARRQGLGRKLLRAAMNEAVNTGAESVFLEVRESNAPAKGLYESYGFIPAGKRKNYYTNPTEDAILMAYTVGRYGEERK